MAEAAGQSNSVLGNIIARYGQLTIGSQHLTPGIIATTVAMGGLVALGKTAVDMLKALAVTSDIASRAKVSVGTLGAIGIAGSNSGIDPKQIQADMLGFSHAVDQARTGVGSLAALLRANGVSAKDTESTFLKIADLVRNASSDASKFSILEQAGLPATREMAKFMEQGSASLRKQIADAKPLTKEMQDQAEAAERFEKAWNSITTKAQNLVQRGILNITGFFESLDAYQKKNSGKSIDQIIAEAEAAQQFKGAPSGVVTRGPLLPPPSAKETVDWQQRKATLGLDAAALSAWGDLATVQQRVEAQYKNLTIAAGDNDRITKFQIQSLLELTRTQAEAAATAARASNGIVTADELMQQKKRELAISVFNGTMTQKQANVALENYARHARDAAEAAEVYGSKLPGLKQLEQESGRLDKQLDTFATGSLNNVTTALADMSMGTASAGDAFRNLGQQVVRALEEMIIKMTIIQPLAKGLQASLGGFNFFGGGGVDLSDISTFVGPKAKGDVFMGGIDGYANQVITKPTMFAFASGAGLMGEAGPEAIMPLQRGPDGKLGVRNGASGASIVNNYYQDFRGVDPSMRAWILNQIKASQRQTLTAAPMATAKASGNNPNLFKS